MSYIIVVRAKTQTRNLPVGIILVTNLFRATINRDLSTFSIEINVLRGVPEMVQRAFSFMFTINSTVYVVYVV